MRIVAIACLLLLLVSAVLTSCGAPAEAASPGSYQVLKTYTATALPPVTLGKSVITLEPVMDFPARSLDLYQACLRDVARINNVDYGG